MSKKRKQQEWQDQQVDLTWMSLEQLGKAFKILASPCPPKKLPKEFRPLNPMEWLALESILVELLRQKQEQSVH